MEIGARSAQVGNHALGGECFQARDGFGRVGLVVEHRQLDLHFFAADRHTAGRVDVLDGKLITGFDLAAERRVTAGEWHDRTDFDRLTLAFGA